MTAEANIRRSDERGHANHGWLEAKHSFSFGSYYDPEHMNYRSLRVINEDRVKPGKGFGSHPHEDMEIITYVIEGSLEHKDSMGNGEIIQEGQFQYMSAGSGVVHSEFNPSSSDQVHLLQIWIQPDNKGYEPRYMDYKPDLAEATNKFVLVAGPEDSDAPIKIRQNVELFTARFEQAPDFSHAFDRTADTWVQVVKGELELNGQTLYQGDGASFDSLQVLTVNASAAEVLVFRFY